MSYFSVSKRLRNEANYCGSLPRNFSFLINFDESRNNPDTRVTFLLYITHE